MLFNWMRYRVMTKNGWTCVSSLEKVFGMIKRKVVLRIEGRNLDDKKEKEIKKVAEEVGLRIKKEKGDLVFYSNKVKTGGD